MKSRSYSKTLIFWPQERPIRCIGKDLEVLGIRHAELLCCGWFVMHEDGRTIIIPY